MKTNYTQSKSCIEFLNEWKDLIKDYTKRNNKNTSSKERSYTITDISIYVDNPVLNVYINAKENNFIQLIQTKINI